MKHLAALAFLFSGAAPLHAQSPDEAYRAGVEARLAGNLPLAREQLEAVVRDQPENTDARVQLGLTYLALDQLDAAEAQFRRTLELAPNYADARIGLARTAQRRGQSDAALAELDRIEGINADAAQLRAQLRAGASETSYRWALDIDGSYSALDGGRPDWREGRIALRHQATLNTNIGGAIEAARRFGRTDVYGEAQAEHRFSERFTGYALFGGTPDADFRPRWQVGLGGALRVHDGQTATVLRLDARHADYRAGEVQTLTPGIEQYLLGGRVWLTGQWINIFDRQSDRHRSGWLGRADLLAAESVRLFAGYADAPDLSEGVVVEVKSLFGGLVLDVGDCSTLRLSVAHEDRATGADRTTFALGLGYRF